MATGIVYLEGEDRESLQNIAESVYLDGECYAFAIALHRGLGWPLVGIMEKGVPRHAMVYGVADHKLYDVRGAFTQGDPALGAPFGMRPPYKQESLREEHLYRVRPVHDRTIAYASHLAETLWPDYPWLNPERKRVAAFLDELEALSRKHRLWIRSGVPGARPHLSRHEGDEDGYTIWPTIDAMGFVFDRRLKRQGHH